MRGFPEGIPLEQDDRCVRKPVKKMWVMDRVSPKGISSEKLAAS